mmetsp:Transcript_25919/g.44812  ORF Transcript_25919/g.44812 Transcript_25919/m.44812 type:complete len:326 (+) Transcript_25919:13-990(+)
MAQGTTTCCFSPFVLVRRSTLEASSAANSDHMSRTWSSASVSETCTICLSGPVALEKFGELCDHSFCAACIHRCEISGHVTCPLCRAARRAVTGPEPSAGREHSGPTISTLTHVPAVDPALRRFPDFACISEKLRRETRFELSTGEIIFDASRHGYNLNTLRSRLLQVRAALLLLEDAEGEKYGVFTGFPWSLPVTHPYGTQDAFLFFANSSLSGGHAMTWRAETSSNVMYSRPDFVAFGSTQDGRSHGLKLNSSLSVANFDRSETFDNPALGTVRLSKVLVMAWGTQADQEYVQFGAADGGRAEAGMLLGLGAARAQAARDWFS